MIPNWRSFIVQIDSSFRLVLECADGRTFRKTEGDYKVASILSQSGMTQPDLAFCSFLSLCSGGSCILSRERLRDWNLQRNPPQCPFLED
jgi:hypothetical protein